MTQQWQRVNGNASEAAKGEEQRISTGRRRSCDRLGGLRTITAAHPTNQLRCGDMRRYPVWSLDGAVAVEGSASAAAEGEEHCISSGSRRGTVHSSGRGGRASHQQRHRVRVCATAVAEGEGQRVSHGCHGDDGETRAFSSGGKQQRPTTTAMAGSASISSVDFSTTPTSNSSDAADNGLLWDVQDILAERTSIDSRKQNELFIVWKACWVPKDNVKPGPVLQRFRAAPKFKFTSAAGDIYWAVEPDTQLALDVAAVQEAKRARTEAAALPGDQRASAHSGGAGAAERCDRTPRKQLGSVARRAFAPGDPKGH